MISATSLRAAPARSRHQPSGREPMTLLPSTKTLDCAARVMPFYGLRHVAGAARNPSAAPLPSQGAMILGAWARDTMAMRIPGSDCADGVDGDFAGIRQTSASEKLLPQLSKRSLEGSSISRESTGRSGPIPMTGRSEDRAISSDGTGKGLVVRRRRILERSSAKMIPSGRHRVPGDGRPRDRSLRR